MNSEGLKGVTNDPTQHEQQAQQRKGGFTQGLPSATVLADQGLGAASVCCGEPAASEEGSAGGGCCGEPVAAAGATSATSGMVTTAGCCGEPASAANGSSCCN